MINGFYSIFSALDARALEQGRELAKINILAVALALLRERRSYGLCLISLYSVSLVVLRGRAAQKSATPGKFAAPGDFFAQRRLRAAAKLLASPDLPGPLAHLVCKFWLGRPPRRANRAAPPASE